MRKRSSRVRAALGAVTAGVLAVAGCQAGAGGAPRPAGTAAGAARAPLWDVSPDSIAAVGDSITRGFDACTVLSDCPEASWATGGDAAVDSLAVRLLGAPGAAERSWNYAVTGARVADLPAQLERAAARRPELVTVMVGGNDACRSSAAAMTPVADFRADFGKAMRTLRAKLPKTQVYVASVPNLKRLWAEGRTNALGRQVWKLGICPSMLADADDLTTAATLRRDTVQRRVVEYNKVLAQVCAEDRRCRFDGNEVYDYRFGTGQLSQWDWFHPSKDGQARLAEIAYRRITARTP
ncbi:SGNH/GDSL hydrolase family protein [Streptomyces sp. NPDC051132]|uniref:SGNH/GDSL hydrolase family protein n=1 Tax=unclassified Streptomyces TaxID=2593676 RepID=UPI00343C3EA1